MKLNLPHFLFINGPAGSGKSTLASMICAEHTNAKRLGFADPIRDMVWSVFFPEHIIEKPFDLRDQKIKNTPITELAKLSGDLISGDGTTVRDTMIAFSERMMKPLLGPDIFGRLLYNRACEESAWYEHFIIDDSGFVPEARAITDKVGLDACHLVRLHRKGCDYTRDSRGYISLPGVQTFDLDNNGSPDEMMSFLHLELGNL